MKLEDTGMTTMDLDFEIPQGGVSVLQFQEGIQKRTNEKSGKTTLQLPLQIVEVVEGPDTNLNCKLSHFCPIETEFGEKQLSGILMMTGLIGQFTQKFKGDVDVTDDAFINALKIKLPGKLIKANHEVKKDQAGKDRSNIIKFEKHGSSGPKASLKTNGGPPAGDDW